MRVRLTSCADRRMWIRALSIEPAIDWAFAAPGKGLRLTLASRFYYKDGKRREASTLVIDDRPPNEDRVAALIASGAGGEYIAEYLGKNELFSRLFVRIAQGEDQAIETPLLFEDTCGGATYNIDVVLP